MTANRKQLLIGAIALEGRSSRNDGRREDFTARATASGVSPTNGRCKVSSS